MKLLVVLVIIGSGLATRLISSDELKKLFKNVVKNEASETDLSVIKDIFEIYKPAHLIERQHETHTRSCYNKHLIANLNVHKTLYFTKLFEHILVVIEYLPNDVLSSPEAYFKTFLKFSYKSLTCLVCRSAFSALIELVRENNSDKNLVAAVTTLCSALNIVSPRLCPGLIDLNLPIITYIIRETPEVSSTTICGLLFQTADSPNSCPYNDIRFEWTVDLPEPYDYDVKNDQVVTKPLTIALVTDAHIDPLYEPNGVANCDEPTCCRKGQKPSTDTNNYDLLEPYLDNSLVRINDDYMINLDTARSMRNVSITSGNSSSASPAGYWGDYRNCDTPIWAYDDVIERMASTHKDIDVIYYMGDSIDHHVWETTYELIDSVNVYVIEKMRKEFGDNVLIVPCIGNHESQPTNQFAPSSVKGDKINTTWLYEALVRKWDYYLTDDAKRSILERGAFSILVRPGLRAISINSNIAYRDNWWLVYDPLDSKRHLEWLVSELHKAERAGEKVHILSHIPPGVHDLTFTWTREYNRIVNRFSKTIAAEFNGHTHSDEFKIFYSGSRAVSVSWGAGSATTYSDYNLNYKIATFNTVTFEPLNIINYIYNLTEANLRPNRRPHWFQLYDVKETFGLTDLSPTSMSTLVYQMVKNKSLYMDLYSAFYSKLSDTRWPYCDDDCKINNICKIVVTVLWQRERCDELRSLFLSSRV